MPHAKQIEEKVSAKPKTIEAIYEHGVFKPVKKLKLPGHERFKLVISPIREDEKATKKLIEKQKKALLEIAGTSGSGLRDVSKNHDKYLYGNPCGRK